MDRERAPGEDGSAKVRRRRGLVVAAGIALATLLVVVVTRPATVEGTATLSECYWGQPIVSIDGGDSYLPVAAWPQGLRYDDDDNAVVDADNEPLIRLGERVAIKGTIVEVHGDIPACFYTRQIRLTSITGLQ